MIEDHEEYMAYVGAATRRFPDLDTAGFRKGRQLDEPRPFEEWLMHEEAFRNCMEILSRLKRIKRPNDHSPTSYGLKHDAEYLSDVNGHHTYVPQGVMTVALHAWDVPIERHGASAVAGVALQSVRLMRDSIQNRLHTQRHKGTHG